MTLTITHLGVFTAQDPEGVKFYPSEDQAAVQADVNGVVYLTSSSYPYTWLKALSFDLPPQAAKVNPTLADLPTVHKFFAERISIYKQEGNGLKFVRNITYDPNLIHWIQKKRGNYVLFHGTPSNLRISGLRNDQYSTYVSPIKEGWPVSHLAPKGAWF